MYAFIYQSNDNIYTYIRICCKEGNTSNLLNPTNIIILIPRSRFSFNLAWLNGDKDNRITKVRRLVERVWDMNISGFKGG